MRKLTNIRLLFYLSHRFFCKKKRVNVTKYFDIILAENFNDFTLPSVISPIFFMFFMLYFLN